MKRAIEEQRENAAENPITAATGQKNNIENLLDIDFDGASPATPSAATPPPPGGLADLMGSPEVQSPVVGGGSNMDDLFGLGMGGGGGGGAGLSNGFEGLDIGGTASPSQQLGSKKTNQDILGLF